MLGFEVARLTIAAAMAEKRPHLAENLGPYMPEVLVSTSMAKVGQAAAVGRAPDVRTIDQLRELTRVAPLNPEPLLVRAAILERDGKLKLAENLLLEARKRDPRSPAARYLLADVRLRDGRIVAGLSEMAILARLIPGSAVQLAPALAEYARAPGANENLKSILRSNPQLRQPLLSALAADPANADLVIDLAGPAKALPSGQSPRWQGRLLDSLIKQGSYDRAYALWRQFAQVPQESKPLVFNEGFRGVPAPPPFNWSFASTGAGFAEPGNGSMRVIYYGRDNAELASQLLLLPSGAYRFASAASGTTVQGALSWVLTCAGSNAPLMEMQIGASSPQAVQFRVPPSGCPAQSLELRGTEQDMPQESDVRIGPVRLERIPA